MHVQKQIQKLQISQNLHLLKIAGKSDRAKKIAIDQKKKLGGK